MSILSDHIEAFIKSMLEEMAQVEMQRGELARRFGCAPSQINYVLSTRFTPNLGYYIESKRGGGGYIRIMRIDMNKDAYVMELVNEVIAESLREQQARSLIAQLYEKRAVTLGEARLMMAAISDKVLPAPQENRDAVRAGILKNMLLALANEMSRKEATEHGTM
ncbi:MAG: CtsR family transcriptional regulator [Eubacteriales bacterium]|nr:CtsR family transcriptional regulator [Eubacteriales bacterium]